MIYDDNFLSELLTKNNRIIYARITALSQEDFPLETIEGRITGGNINVDGKSALRRTCSLSIVANQISICNYYWSFQNKFKLEIGLKNNIDNIYPNIIWFPQGIYIITNFSNSISNNSNQINISGKDKMCLLNGEVSGTFNSQIDFGKLDTVDKNGRRTLIKIPIKKIIREMVHQYGGEPFYNIIINDLDDSGLELQEYRLDKPFYICRINGNDVFNFGTLDEETPIKYLDEKGNMISSTINNIPHYEQLFLHENDNPTNVYIGDDEKNLYTVVKIEFGDTVGYKETPLVYDGDLIANVGETITSILDKIKTMLVYYEYYYNLEGQFIFQKKNKNQKKIEAFQDNYLLTSFNNNPNLLEVRNDYTVWGKRQSLSGAEIPIHGRYAIQQKPIEYTSITVTDEELAEYNKAYGSNVKGQEGKTYSIKEYDWRELIYQMSLDYHAYNHLDDFELKIIKANPKNFSSGRTGYEQYYIDMEGFWRQLYNPNAEEELSKNNLKKSESEQKIKILKEQLEKATDEKEKNKYNIALLEEQEELRKINNKIIELENFYLEGDFKYWNKDRFESPEALNFYFDLLDSEGSISQFSIEAIGDRPKVNNNDKIKSILYRKIPYIIFGKPLGKPKTGYRYFNVEGFENAFQISHQGKSIQDEIDQLVSNYSDCIENISISAIPYYTLKPNTVIIINDTANGINGEYIVSKYTISFNYNSTMNITAQKNIRGVFY